MKQVFRSNLAAIAGWVWMVFAAFSAVDLVVRYGGQSSMVAAAVLGVLTVLVFATCLRPAVVMSEKGVLVRNPLRNTFVPWRGVDEVTVSHSVTISSGDGSVRCWVPQTSARERAAAVRKGRPAGTRSRFRPEPVLSRGEQAAAEAMAGKTHADWVAEQITERAEAARRTASMTGTATVAGTATTPGTVTETGTTAGTEGGVPEAVLRTTWSPSALAALAVAALLVVAAFLA